MYDLPVNTIYMYEKNPLFSKIDSSSLSMNDFIREYDFFSKKKPMVKPESDALSFYFLNHAFHILKSKYHPLEALPQDLAYVAEQHITITNTISKRLLFYSYIIALEEASFLHEQSSDFWLFLKTRYGKNFEEFAQNRFPQESSRVAKLDMTCGEYASAIMSVFAFGKWSSGFGGKGWVPIASLFSNFIHGSISLEQFSDQAFSLSHNNGSMFNKGHFYQMYSPFIYTILDIQDSGQIPQWIYTNQKNKFVSSELLKVYTIMEKYFPEEIQGKFNQSLVTNSQNKREKKSQLLKQHQIATWNNSSNSSSMQKPTAETKLNNILLGGFK